MHLTISSFSNLTTNYFNYLHINNCVNLQVSSVFKTIFTVIRRQHFLITIILNSYLNFDLRRVLKAHLI
jgi:hypothetical protein